MMQCNNININYINSFNYFIVTIFKQLNRKPKNASCGHILCEDCWDKCLKIKLECPICKRKVREKSLTNLFI